MKKINIEYIGFGLYEASLLGCDIRGVGCTKIEAINNLLEEDIPLDEVGEIVNIEYIGYGLYEASHKEIPIRCVGNDKLGAIRKLYSALLKVA